VSRDIAEWLNGLGLEQYAVAFADNRIGLDVLPDLTEADFENIGIPLGDRKRLLKAIAALSERSEESAARGVPPAPSPDAERRQLTVMFCDLVGSTALSGALDPEDFREVMRAYQEAVAAVVGRYDGYLAKYLGDGILVYFGYPQAHEDDAERAVRAGLAMVLAVAALRPRPDLSLASRIGIATGLVVVGDMVGQGVSEERAVSGETPNLAARLQALAEPDTVVISAGTHALVEGLFICEDLGPQSLKGISKPVGGYRVREETVARSRFEAAASRGLMPLVGREHEIGLLEERWQQATEGDGQVVLLTGEAGIGKSRIVQTLRERLAAEDHVRLRYQCSPYHTNSALHPIIDQLARTAEFARNDTPEIRLGKLEALLAQSSERLEEVTPLFAALLSIPTGDRYAALEMSPELQKERTLSALVERMSDLAARQPLLVIFEDAHWIDPTTHELLDLIVDRAQNIEALVLITSRPIFTAPWGGHPHATSLTLNRLGRKQSQKMVRALTGNKPLPEEVLSQILARIDGVPLFAEELTKTVLEAGFLKEEADRYVLTGPLPPLAIPATLHDSLMARLDRLSPIKEIAQTAATIGREFSHELLAAVSTASDNELEDALVQLTDAELVFRRGTSPQASYIFKHALIREAAYESLLKSKRHELHGRIAKVLQAQFSETAAAQPELLAHHFTEAGFIEEAIGYWQQAGEQAIQRSANVEAISHLTTALEHLKTLPATSERTHRELLLQVALGPAWIAVKGYAASEVGQTYTRAHELCRQLGDPPQLVPVLAGLWLFHLLRVELHTARELAEELHRLARRTRDPGALLSAGNALGNTLCLLGEFSAARVHLERAMSIYDPQTHGTLAYLYGDDPGVGCLVPWAWCLWYLGYPDQASKRMQEAVAMAREISHPHSLAFAHFAAAMLHQLRRERQLAQEQAEAAMAISSEQGFPFYSALGTILRGWAQAEQGQANEGIAQMRQGLVAYRTTGTRWLEPYVLAILAEAHGNTGQVHEGLQVLTEALDVIQATRERAWEAELYRIKGELLLKSRGQDRESSVQQNEKARVASPESEAEACFREAMEIARCQEAKSWDLRAAMSLGRLWRSQGKEAEARQLLAEAYGWFTEGFDTPDLKDAKALLDELQ
jgi:predicted ATPase/class 3 adenylate cyclase